MQDPHEPIVLNDENSLSAEADGYLLDTYYDVFVPIVLTDENSVSAEDFGHLLDVLFSTAPTDKNKENKVIINTDYTLTHLDEVLKAKNDRPYFVLDGKANYIPKAVIAEVEAFFATFVKDDRKPSGVFRCGRCHGLHDTSAEVAACYKVTPALQGVKPQWTAPNGKNLQSKWFANVNEARIWAGENGITNDRLVIKRCNNKNGFWLRWTV